jgi:hypothetical protein
MPFSFDKGCLILTQSINAIFHAHIQGLLLQAILSEMPSPNMTPAALAIGGPIINQDVEVYCCY